MVKKGDMILSVGIIVLAVILFLCFFLFKTEGKQVVITVDGEVFGTYSISTDQEIEVKTERGVNIVAIFDGKVSVTAADCPDKYCVSHVAVNETGETVVCLPHRMIVEVVE
ncbi:MAG: NusG domain II-containing protein [Clostridia bacterium]|nr:NusG domain II-containing protein [Clostridia bacterium]